MPDIVGFIFGLFVIAILIGLITVVGHGFWLLAAAMWREISDSGESSADAGFRCPACGAVRGERYGSCMRCGYGPQAGSDEKQRRGRGLLERLHAAERISDHDFVQLMQALGETGDTVGKPERASSASVDDFELNAPGAGNESPGPSTADESAAAGPDRPSPGITLLSSISNREVDTSGAETDAEAPVEAELVLEPTQATAAPPRQPPPSASLSPPAAEADHPGSRRFWTRQTVANMLQSFMDEKNIRWGELASGMLIVGSAIGLVVSLRAQLQELSDRIPYFPALLLMLGTVAIHGAGLYTLRRWKLRATSRGVLIIATLLVPLSFAAGMLLSGTADQRPPVGSPIYLAAVFVGILGYGIVTSFSAHALFPVGWWRITVAVMGTSVGQLLIDRLGGHDAAATLSGATALFALPLASFLLPLVSQLQSVSRSARLTPARAAQTLTVLGIAAFSLAVPASFQLVAGETVGETLAALSPSLSLVAAAVLGAGMVLQQHCESQRMSNIRTAGTALALLGGMLMIGPVVTAWPRPEILIAVAILTAGVLAFLAQLGRLAVLHLGVVAVVSFAGLLSYHHVMGQFDLTEPISSSDLVRVLAMGRSSVVLLVPALLSACAGLLLFHGRRKSEGRIYLAAAAAVASISLIISLFAGFHPAGEDANWATVTVLTYAVAGLALTPLLKRNAVAGFGSVALLLGLIHLLCFNTWFQSQLIAWWAPAERPLLLATLLHGALVAFYGLGIQVYQGRVQSGTNSSLTTGMLNAFQLLALSGVLTSCLTIPFVLHVSQGAFGDHGGYAACVALVWALAGGAVRDARLVTGSQFAGTIALSFAVAAFAGGQGWPHGLRDLRHWQVQIAVLALGSLLLTAIRMATKRRPAWRELLDPDWPSVDAVVLSGLTAAMVFLAATACWTGVQVELGMLDPVSAAAQDVWHTVAYASGSWIAFGCMFAAVGLLLYERANTFRSAALITLTATVPLLAAGPFEASCSAASAVRWFFAAYLWGWVGLISFRVPLSRIAGQAVGSSRSSDPRSGTSWRCVRNLAVLYGVLPVLLLTTAAIGQLAAGIAPNGPAAESWFATMNASLLYLAPLCLLAAGTLTIAARDGIPTHALLGSVLLQYAVVLFILLPHLGPDADWEIDVGVSLVQWISCGLAGYTLVWFALSRWIDRYQAGGQPGLFTWHWGVSLATAVFLAAWITGALVLSPWRVDAAVDLLGRWPSYLAVGLVSLASYCYFFGNQARLAVWGIASATALVILVAASSNAYDAGGEWLSYHTLTGGLLVVSLGAAVVGWWQRFVLGGPGLPGAAERCAGILALFVFFLLARGCEGDPIVTWWTPTISAGLFTYFSVQAILTGGRYHTYCSALVGLFAAGVLWCHLSAATAEQFACGFVYTHVTAAGLIGLFWLALEMKYRSERDAWLAAQHPPIPIHSVLALWGTVSMMVFGLGFSAVSIAQALIENNNGSSMPGWWAVAAQSALGLLLAGIFCQRRIGPTLVASYLWGWISIAVGLNLLQQGEVLGTGRLGAYWLVVAAALAGAVYVALSSKVWKESVRLVPWALRWGLPRLLEKRHYVSQWLPTCNVLASCGMCGLGALAVFGPGRDMGADVQWRLRLTVALAPAISAYGVACLGGKRHDSSMKCLALLLLALGVVFGSWADLPAVDSSVVILAYNARLLVAIAGMTLLYSLLLTRWTEAAEGWFSAARRGTAILAATTIMALFTVLLLELKLFEKGVGAPIATPEVVAVSIMLFGFVIALLTMAILPGRDPFALTEKGRQAYVYAAQAMAALLFAHIHLAKPTLFRLNLVAYWPYVVMGIAFMSVAFSELCFRKQWRVIAEPMHRTGGFLPLLPALTAWTFFPEGSYPLILFFGGLIYVFISISRRSFLAGGIAAVMGNGALWGLFLDHGWKITHQPQLWMIPPAVSVLGASYINRDRLGNNALTAIRYICVMIIYLSSAGEMFMKLLPEDANDWARPLILTSLSVAGIFVGIVLRVRAFLYLGTSFLLLSIVAMVWNAQRLVDHSWPWWAFGISLGLLILLIFGLFEKYREDVKQLIAHLRQWAP